MSEKVKFSTDFFEAMLIVAVLVTWGKPDIIDGITHHLTGVKVWECLSNDCVTKPEAGNGAR